MDRDVSDRLSQLSDDELDALVEIAQARASGQATRRDVLKGAGALGVGALLGGGATGAVSAEASTTDGDGNVGRPSEPVDVFADGVDTTTATIGADSRPLISTENRTLNVPTDYTFQGALNEIPLFVKHLYDINVDDGDRTNTDVHDPYWVGWKDYETGERGAVQITGNTTTPSNNKIGSIFSMNGPGHKPLQISGFQFEGGSPYDDESPAVGSYGGGEVEVSDCILNNSRGDMGYGFVSYSSTLNAYGVDLGNQVTSDSGFLAKDSGVVFVQNSNGNAINGVQGTAGNYLIDGSGIAIIENVDATGANGISSGIGIHYNSTLQRYYGTGQPYYAASDAELGTVLANVSSGDVVRLAAGEDFTTNRTISTNLRFESAGAGGTGAGIGGDWTLNARVDLVGLGIPGGTAGTITVSSGYCLVTDSFLPSGQAFNVDGDQFRFVDNRGGTVTFNSGASSGIVDGCVATSTTDNDGSNTIGDVA